MNQPSFVQVDLPTKQNGNEFPVIPENYRKLPARPYLFVTFKTKKYVLMWDGYKLTDVHRGKTGKKSRYPCRRSGKDTGNGIWGDLLGAQGLDGVALGCAAGRDDAGQNGQQGGQRHEEEGRVHGQGGHEGRGARDFLDDDIAGDEEDLAEDDAHDARAEADDEGLCVEHLGDVPLGGTDGPEDADLLPALKDADIGDDADHDGGNDQRDGDEGHHHAADHVHDLGHTGHQGAHEVGVLHHFFVLALRGHPCVVGVQLFQNDRLAGEVLRVDLDLAGGVLICIAEGRQVGFVGGRGGAEGGAHQLRQLGGGHVELDGFLEGRRVDLDGTLHLAAQLADVLLDGRLELGLDLILEGDDALLDGSVQLAFQR